MAITQKKVYLLCKGVLCLYILHIIIPCLLYGAYRVGGKKGGLCFRLKWRPVATYHAVTDYNGVEIAAVIVGQVLIRGG